MSRNDMIKLTIMKKVCDCQVDENCTGEGRFGVQYYPCIDNAEIDNVPPVIMCRKHLKDYLEDEDNKWTEYRWIEVE